VSGTAAWGVPALLLLGAYHGVNPGMGWLFAVALGIQEQRSAAVAWSLVPITIGHALAIAAAIAVAGALGLVLPLFPLRIVTAALLLALGGYRLFRHRHPKGGGMRVGFRDLVAWSFLMASAHGAGLMVLPILFGMSAEGHAGHSTGGETVGSAALAVGVHTAGYILVTLVIAFVVYAKVGLAVLRKAWVNLDLIWAGALVVSGLLTLIV
jgi:hypothetical protein